MEIGILIKIRFEQLENIRLQEMLLHQKKRTSESE
jgi:hypothetical protein